VSILAWGASDWERIREYMPDLLEGAVITLKVAWLSLALGTLIGIAVAMTSRSRFMAVRTVTAVYVQVGRAVPEIVQVFIWYFVLPDYGIVLSPFSAGVIAIGVAFGPYLGEVFRAGVEAVPRTQWEASQVLGLSRLQIWRRIVFPQAFRTVAPVYTGYFISIFKATALLSFISLREVFGVARNLAALNFRYIELFTIVMIIYLLMGIPAVLLMRAVERRWRVDRPQEIDINAALSQS
jgi:polar amino acid transport system permease protein